MSPPVEVKEEITAEVNASIWGSLSSTEMEKVTTLPTLPSTVFNLARKIAYLQIKNEFTFKRKFKVRPK